MPKRNIRSPKRNGRDLRVSLKEATPHSEDSKMISEEIMLIQTHFLVLEVEVEEEVE